MVIRTSSEYEKYRGVISLLRFFIEDRKYSVVDRIANALTPEAVIQALYDAERIVESLREKALEAEISVGEKTYSVICCDYGEGKKAGISGVAVKASDPRYVNKEIWCVRCPLTPSQKEIEDLIDKVKNNIGLAKELALLAYTRMG